MAVVAVVPFILYLVRFCSSKSCKKCELCDQFESPIVRVRDRRPYPPYVATRTSYSYEQGTSTNLPNSFLPRIRPFSSATSTVRRTVQYSLARLFTLFDFFWAHVHINPTVL